MMPTLHSKNTRFAPKTTSLFKQWNAMLLLLFMMLSGGMFGQYSGTGTFTKITSLAQLTDGYYVITNETDAFLMTNGRSGSDTGGYFTHLATSPISGVITNPSKDNVWKIEVNGSGRTIYNEMISKYVGYGGSGNSASIEDTPANSNRWTFSYANSEFTANNLAITARKLSFNNNSVAYRFATYTSEQNQLQLYKYAPSGFTVTFDGNGSTGGTMDNQTAATATALTTNAFTRTNYTFTGWNTAADGSGTAYANTASYPFTENTTLYAQWTPNYSISFANLQFPSTGIINEGGSFDVYGQVYAENLTEAAGAGAGITAEFGYSTTDNNPNTPTGWTWVPATFNAQLEANDEYKATFSVLALGTYYYATRFKFADEPWVYGGYRDNNPSPTAGGIWNGVTNISGTLNVISNVVDYANLELPYAGTITQGADFNANAKVYKAGFTEPAGASTAINAWIGISTTNATTTSDFSSGWTWIPATFNTQVGNDEIYTANIAGASRPAGTYYYVSRFQVTGSSEYKYGGTNNNFWTAPENSGVLTITAPTVAATPGTLNSFTYVYGSGPSGEQSFTVSGSYLTANLEVTAPANYEVSTSSSSGFTSALSFTPASGTVASTLIYVRLKANLPVATYNQSVSISSTAASSATVALNGSVTKKALTVTGAMAQNKPYDATTTATITGATLVGVIAPDVVSIAGGGTFATANVGTGIAVTANLTLSGANAGNYSLTQPTGLTANITAIAPTFTTLPINLLVAGTYTLPGGNITSTSTGALTYSITSGGKATLSGTTLTGVAAGSETLTVNQAASGNYTAGSTTVMVNVSACSPPIWEENFDFGGCDVTDISTNGEFMGNWSFISSQSNPLKYNTNGLSYTGYPGSGLGGSAQYQLGSGHDFKREFSSTGITSGAVYASFLINLNSATTTSNDYVVSLADATGNGYQGRVYVIKSGSQFKLGVSKQSSNTAENQSGLLNFGTTYLVVIKYEMQNLTGNTDPFKMWVINGGSIPSTEASAGTSINASTSGTDATNLKYFVIRQVGSTDGFIDGIRVATTWESLFCGSTTTPSATTYTWTGASSSSWSNAGNWSPSGVPRSIDNIIISTPGTNQLNITDCRSIKNFTLNGTGNFKMSASGIFTIEGDVAYGGTATATLDCASQVFIKSPSSQLIPPLTYGNLDVLGGNRVFSPAGIIKICGEFKVVPDPSTSIYTVTGSTVEYISPSGGFFMAPFTYNNLTFSGSSNFILEDVIINVNGNYEQSAGVVRLGDPSNATLNITGNANLSGTGKIDAYFGDNILVNIQGNFSQSGTSELLLQANNNTLNIGGNYSISENSYFDTYFGPATIFIGGNYIQNDGLFFLADENTAVLNIEQNMTINGTGEVDLNYTAGGTGIVNLKGDLVVNAPAILAASNASVSHFNFIGIGDGLTPNTTQTIDFSTITSAQKINFNVSAGAHVKLINQNFTLGSNSKFIVENNGIFDFGFNGITELNILPVSGQTMQIFEAKPGSTLKVTSPVGLTNTTALGNVQTPVAGRIFSTGANYYYIGKVDQVSGNGLPNALTGTITVELDTDELIFKASGNKTINTAGTLNIKKGIVEDTSSNSFGDAAANTGNLTMSGGRYRILKGSTQPDLSGNYNLTGGIMEYAGSLAKTIRSPKSYQNIEVTGTNVGNSSGHINLNDLGTFNVKNGGVFTINANSIKGDTGAQTLTVENGGTFKTGDEHGFSGSTNTSVNTNIESIILQEGSTVEYLKAGNQTITNQVVTVEPTADINLSNSSYSNLKLSGSGTKNFTGSKLKVGNNLDVEGTSLLPVTGTQTLIVNKKITTIDADAALSNGVPGDLSNISTTTTKGILIQNNGSLVQIADVMNSNGNLNTGKIQMERIAQPMFRYDYTYWSSPVENTFTLSNLSPNTLANKYFQWNHAATTPIWQVLQGGTSVMEAGKGYIVRAPQLFDVEGVGLAVAKNFNANFIGKPNNGTVTIEVTGSSDAAVNKWNLIGNPYPSALDADLFLDLNADTNNILGGTLYFWTHNTGIGITENPTYSYASADYASYNGVGGTETNEAVSDPDILTDNAPSGKIAAGQGFFVKGIASGNATFNNSMRIAGENDQFFKSPTTVEKHRVWLNMKGTTKGFSQALVGYVTNATNGLDNRFDGETFGGNQVTFYSMLDTKALVIQGRALPFLDSDTVPLGYKSTITENISIGIDHFDGLFDNQNIYLEDTDLNIVHDLKDSDYTFAGVPGTFNSRFILRYQPEEVLANPTFEQELQSVIIRKNDAILRVNSPYETINTIWVYDLMGRLVFEQKNCNTHTFETNQITQTNQTLVVKVKLNNGGVVTEKILD